MEIAPDITPEAMMAAIVTKPTITTKPVKHVVTFTKADLPLEGTDHNKPLHVTMKCMGKWIPVVLIDNGSALNVCPLRTALCLGLKPKDFTPSDLTVRAYDNTRRNVLGTVEMEIAAEGFKSTVEFHVLEIPASFNLLLGRPWMHRPDIMAVPSTLHQKVLLGLENGTVALYGDTGIRPHAEDNAPLLEIIHDENDVQIGGFAFDTSGGVFTLRVDEDFSISTTVLEMMRRMSYLPGTGLGRTH
jgi:hypothetical protein